MSDLQNCAMCGAPWAQLCQEKDDRITQLQQRVEALEAELCSRYKDEHISTLFGEPFDYWLGLKERVESEEAHYCRLVEQMKWRDEHIRAKDDAIAALMSGLKQDGYP